jgi:hypothetical protein
VGSPDAGGKRLWLRYAAVLKDVANPPGSLMHSPQHSAAQSMHTQVDQRQSLTAQQPSGQLSDLLPRCQKRVQILAVSPRGFM